jgi:hypothetical protein
VKVIVAGSRSVNDSALVDLAIQKSGFEITEEVCGMAIGVDLLGRGWAKAHNIPVKEMPANWRPNGTLERDAGYR